VGGGDEHKRSDAVPLSSIDVIVPAGGSFALKRPATHELTTQMCFEEIKGGRITEDKYSNYTACMAKAGYRP
jgi:hypothetical protein